MDTPYIILSALYFMLPAFASNALPVIAAKLNIFPSLAIPVDGSKKLNGTHLFGKSKTLRGFAVGIDGAILVGLLQYFLYQFESIQYISLIPYTVANSLLLGLLLGTGALIGDLTKSFIKRRLNIKSGSPWIIADQIDYAVGALLFAALIIILPISQIIVILVIAPCMSIIANMIAYKLGVKKVWW